MIRKTLAVVAVTLTLTLTMLAGVAAAGIVADIRSSSIPGPTLDCHEDSVTVLVVSRWRENRQRPTTPRLACVAIDNLTRPRR
jgi:hypothetical protein